MNNKWGPIRDRMFKSVDDPHKSRWWESAWEVLIDPKLGSKINAESSDSEIAMWLVVLKGIQSEYESAYFGSEPDLLLLDYWDSTEESLGSLEIVLFGTNKLNNVENISVADIDSDMKFRNMLQESFIKKRKELFKMMKMKYKDDMDLIMLFLGGKIPRDRDAAHRVASFVENGFFI